MPTSSRVSSALLGAYLLLKLHVGWRRNLVVTAECPHSPAGRQVPVRNSHALCNVEEEHTTVCGFAYACAQLTPS